MNGWCMGLVGLAGLIGIGGTGLAVAASDLDTIRALADQGQPQEAIAKLDERIDADGNDIQALFLKGLLLLEQGNIDPARETFQVIARRYPRLPGAFNNLAVIYASEGEYDQARQNLLIAIANAPDYAEPRGNLGDLYAKMAVEAYRKAVELDADDEASKAKLKVMESLFAAED